MMYRLELRRLGVVIKEFETDSRKQARETAKNWWQTTVEAVVILFVDGKEVRLKNVKKELGIRGKDYDNISRYSMKLDDVQRIIRHSGTGFGGRVSQKFNREGKE